MRTLIVISEVKFSQDVTVDYDQRSHIGHAITQAVAEDLRALDADVEVFTFTGEPQSVDELLANWQHKPDEDDLKTRTRALVRTLKENEARFNWPAGIVGFMVQCMDAELRPPGGWGAEQGSQREIGENDKFTPEEEEDDGETKIMRMVIMREPVGDAKDRLPPGLPVEEVPGELLSASIGGNEEVGYYLNFRGTPDDVIKMLDRVSATAAVALPQGLYEDHT